MLGASTTRMLLLTTLFPCLAADSLRGLGSAVPNNTTATRMQKQFYAASSTAACTSADEAKMTELGSGNADGTFPKILSNCGKRNYNIFSGFNAHNFVDCVTEKTGVTFDCGSCFVAPARYGANNCKWSCLWGSWCGKGCLDCIGKKNEESQQCAGVKVPTATACR